MSADRSALGMLDATEIAATFPDPFLVLTLNLTVEYASQRFYDFFEASEAETIGKPLRELGNGQWDIPSLLEPLERVIETKTSIEDYEVEHTFENIGHRIMLLNARKTIRPGNGSTRILLVLEDVTAEALAAREMEKQERLMTGIVGTLREPLLVLDADQVILTASEAFYRVFDTSPDATIGKPLQKMGNGQWNIPELHKMLGEVLTENAPVVDFEVRQNFPGIGEKFIVLNAHKILRDGKNSRTILLAMQDATLEKRLERAQQAALERANDLLEELNHRVMNSLAMIGSIMAIESRSLSDDDCKAAFERINSRVMSIGALYRGLVRNESVNQVSADEYIGGVVRDAVSAFGPPEWELQIDLDLPPISLTTEIAVPMGLVVNELAINSLKYAYAGRQTGRLSVSIANSAEGIKILFSDDGPGIDENARVDSGLGQRLTSALVQQMGGTIALDSGDGGTRYTIAIPASSNSARSAGNVG
ncbi:sensor histidine kinase [Erythrobacter sp. MTPC3]|uniref:sensor histidine kinase n=1 Tax=Erythrobacter sp. MTPC3 TaxID=3056564 RepID=UPI0036F21544